jgi:RNA polymerase sigma-70 factor (ECF subfamily)
MHSDPQSYETHTLVRMLAQDSEYAFQLLYDRHRDRIYQVAVRYLKSPMSAQEVVQDVFLKLWINRMQIDATRPLEAWLYTVARNAIVNRLRKLASEWKATRPLTTPDEPLESPIDAKIDDRMYQRWYQEALAGLSDQQRTVFLLAREEKLSYAEIGERLSLSPLTVKTHMARALDSFRRFMESKGIELGIALIVFS